MQKSMFNSIFETGNCDKDWIVLDPYSLYMKTPALCDNLNRHNFVPRYLQTVLADIVYIITQDEFAAFMVASAKCVPGGTFNNIVDSLANQGNSLLNDLFSVKPGSVVDPEHSIYQKSDYVFVPMQYGSWWRPTAHLKWFMQPMCEHAYGALGPFYYGSRFFTSQSLKNVVAALKLYCDIGDSGLISLTSSSVCPECILKARRWERELR